MILTPELLRPGVLSGAIRPWSLPLALRLLDLAARSHPYGFSARIVRRAPATLAELLDAWDGRGPVPVSCRHARRTIWGSLALNALFRAWHDATHANLGAEFDTAGEYRVARAQCALVEDELRPILWAETAGQVSFRSSRGRFPDDQLAFVVAAVRHGIAHAIETTS